MMEATMTTTDEQSIDWETWCFQMITAAGEAKSDYMEALQAAKEQDTNKADELMTSGDKHFATCHDLHTSLVQREASGNPVQVSLLLTHVEDQMMSAEIIKTLVVELRALYTRLAR
jgi:cellobiose PTS system EIIA component